MKSHYGTSFPAPENLPGTESALPAAAAILAAPKTASEIARLSREAYQNHRGAARSRRIPLRGPSRLPRHGLLRRRFRPRRQSPPRPGLRRHHLGTQRLPRLRTGRPGRDHRPPFRNGHRQPHFAAPGRCRRTRRGLEARAPRTGHRRYPLRLPEHRRLLLRSRFRGSHAPGRRHRPAHARTRRRTEVERTRLRVHAQTRRGHPRPLPPHRQHRRTGLHRLHSPLPKKEELRFKKPEEYRYIGKPVAVIDQHDIVTGKAVFGMDAKRPGMLYAVGPAPARLRLQSQIARRCRHAQGEGRPEDRSTSALQTAAPLPATGRRRRGRRLHLRRHPGPQEPQNRVGRQPRSRLLQLRLLQAGAFRQRPQARQGRPQSGRFRPRLRRRCQEARGRLLRPHAGPRAHGAACGHRRIPQMAKWKPGAPRRIPRPSRTPSPPRSASLPRTSPATSPCWAADSAANPSRITSSKRPCSRRPWASRSKSSGPAKTISASTITTPSPPCT